MIKLQNLTPQVYYKQSRDFQFIGRLYDIVLNSIKTNADNLYSLPIGDSANDQTLSLLAYTLGFKAKHSYDSSQLKSVCSVLPKILRYKGSLKAFLIAAQAVLSTQGISQRVSYSIEDKKKITLYVSQYLSNLTLLYDLLDYILPAGMSCEIVQELSEIREITTTLELESSVKAELVPEQDFPWRTIYNSLNISNEDLNKQSGNIWNDTIAKQPISNIFREENKTPKENN